MKKLLSCFVLIFPVLVYAQSNNSSWGAINKFVNASSFTGKRFRLEAAVKVQVLEPTAQAELWTRVDKTNRKMGFFYNMRDKPIRSNNWTVYTIEGKVDKDAERLAFGGIYEGKGIFYFDHFRLWIEKKKNEFEEVPLPNGDFEADTLESWYYLKNQNGFAVTLATDTAFHGNKSIRIDGSTFKQAPEFGANDSTGRYGLVNGIKIYYETYGTGEPLLLLHGNSQSIHSFKAQIPALSAKYKVIAVDTRGQGKSGDDGKTYTYDLFAEDMNALLDYLHIDSARIVGWSDGGNTGLIMAMKYPAKVKQLVTMGANVFIDKTVVDKIVFKEIDRQLKQLKNDTTAWGKNRVRLLNMLLTEPRHTFEELRAIHCPVLVMAGENDLILPEHTKGIAKHISRGTLLIAPKETHDYPSQNAASFNKVVLDFFER